jgi:hypothetical protein
LSFLSIVATRYSMMDNADPKYLFHTKETSRQKMLFVRDQLAGTEFPSETYKLYAKLKEYSSYEEFTQRLITTLLRTWEMSGKPQQKPVWLIRTRKNLMRFRLNFGRLSQLMNVEILENKYYLFLAQRSGC